MMKEIYVNGPTISGMDGTNQIMIDYSDPDQVTTISAAGSDLCPEVLSHESLSETEASTQSIGHITLDADTAMAAATKDDQEPTNVGPDDYTITGVSERIGCPVVLSQSKAEAKAAWADLSDGELVECASDQLELEGAVLGTKPPKARRRADRRKAKSAARRELWQPEEAVNDLSAQADLARLDLFLEQAPRLQSVGLEVPPVWLEEIARLMRLTSSLRGAHCERSSLLESLGL